MNAFTTNAAAQQDAVKVRGTRKSKKVEEVVIEPVKKTLAEKLEELFNDVEEFGVAIPSWKRVAAATFTSFALAFGAGYGIGSIASYAVVGILTLTGSMALAVITYALAVLLALYVGMKIGQHVGGYILSGQIDRDFIAAKNKVASFFKRRDVVSE